MGQLSNTNLLIEPHVTRGLHMTGIDRKLSFGITFGFSSCDVVVMLLINFHLKNYYNNVGCSTLIKQGKILNSTRTNGRI